MKIGILTQPLVINYGGLLQAFALKSVLEHLGHHVYVIDVRFCNYNFVARLRHWVSLLFDQILPQRRFYKKQVKNGVLFKKKYIKYIVNKEVKLYRFDAVIVGSDQVWRPSMNNKIETMFLDFLGNDSRIKRIAYAASFGIDTWEFNDAQTQNCKNLIRKFDSVSVREDSGVDLCAKYFETLAQHVIDPTLLLTADDYLTTFLPNLKDVNKKSIFVYMLDMDKKKQDIIDNTKSLLNLNVNIITLRNTNLIDTMVYPSVNSWLEGIAVSQFVITDSFHSCVFSILFNKPFLVIVNSKTGKARISSLLKLFKLEDRLIETNTDYNPQLLFEPLDKAFVNQVLKDERQKALQFLIDALN